MLVGALAWSSSPANAAEVALAGVFGHRVALVIDGGAPVTLAVGQSTGGIRLVKVMGDAALLEVEGRPLQVRLGEQVVQRAGKAHTHVLHGDSRGHFAPQGEINGRPVRFLVDTGASLVSMGLSDARRLGLDLSQAPSGQAQTANGVTRVRRVRLDSVRVGPIVVYDVEASVHDHDLPMVLLGMSFLSRMEISHEGNRMTLRRRF